MALYAVSQTIKRLPEIGSLYQRCFFVDKLTHIRIKPSLL
jgi:hypothetical protein